MKKKQHLTERARVHQYLVNIQKEYGRDMWVDTLTIADRLNIRKDNVSSILSNLRKLGDTSARPTGHYNTLEHRAEKVGVRKAYAKSKQRHSYGTKTRVPVQVDKQTNRQRIDTLIEVAARIEAEHEALKQFADTVRAALDKLDAVM